MPTIYCMNCGAELPEGSRFCPACESPTLLGAGLAEEAGQQIVCPSCRLYNDAHAERCERCGHALGEAARESSRSLVSRISNSPVGKMAVVGAAGIAVAAVVAGVVVSTGASGDKQATEQQAESAPAQEIVADKGANPEELGIVGPEVRDSLSVYSWKDLADIGKEIGGCDSRDAAMQIAREYHLVGDDLHMLPDTKELTIAGLGDVSLRLVDVYHDDRGDGQGKAGLTFMATNLPFTHPMNDEDTDEGGWGASGLRKWLNGEVYEALDPELKDAVVKVKKLTNNVGDATDASCVSATDDFLWVPSMKELIGTIGWSADADGTNGDGLNAIANAEGEQYAAFREEQVVESGANETLALSGGEGPLVWWTRSCSPTTALTYFHGVNESGDLVNLYIPVRDNGVAIGFCL